MPQPIVADLIERLRQRSANIAYVWKDDDTVAMIEEAAQLIESQREVIAGLVEALESAVDRMDGEYGFGDPKAVYGNIILAAKTHLGEK